MKEDIDDICLEPRRPFRPAVHTLNDITARSSARRQLELAGTVHFPTAKVMDTMRTDRRFVFGEAIDMKGPLESPAEEITRLRGCLNDLIRITTLPALSMAGEPSRIGATLLDLLIGMLPLSFAFVRLNDPEGGPPREETRVAAPLEDSTREYWIRQALEAALGDASLKSPLNARVSIGGVEFSIASTPLGFQGELGVIVAASQKLDFPEQIEALFLAVAANQATIALQQARLFIAQRKREFATPKDESERSERESWRIIDSIPGPIALLKKSGDVDMVNRTAVLL